MPDFDKDLSPIIKTPPEEEILPVNPSVPEYSAPDYSSPFQKSSEGVESYRSGGSSALLQNLAAKRAGAGEQMEVGYDTLGNNKRYATYNPTVPNQEEYKAFGQSISNKWGNALAKTGAFTLGTFLQGFGTIPDTIAAIKNGKMSELSNPQGYENDIDLWLKNVEDQFPNYYTDWETKHPFKSAIPFSGGATNFWADKFVKNIGFTAGAIASAVAQDAIVGLATGLVGDAPLIASQVGKASLWLNKIFSGTNKLERVLQLGADVGKTGEQLLKIKRIGEVAEGMRVGNQAKFLTNLYGAARTEGAIEARDGYRTLKEDLISHYKEDNNGLEPVGTELDDIEKTATAAMNTRLGINLAILMVSDAIQWDNMLRPFNSSKWGLKSTITKDIEGAGKIALKAGSLDEFEAVPIKGIGNKIWNRVKPHIPAILSEGVYEEGGQYAAQTGTFDYYKNKYNKTHNSQAWDTLSEVMNSTVHGLSEEFGSSEGLENIFLGGLTGGILGGGRSLISDDTSSKRRATVLNLLNGQSLTGALGNKVKDATQTLENKEGILKAVQSDNVFEFKNLKHKEFFNFIHSGLQAGRFDVRMEQLKMLAGMDDEQFSSLFGIDPTKENKQTASEYVAGLIQKAEYIKSIHSSIESTYTNPFTHVNTPKTKGEVLENLKHSTFESWKGNLTYLASIGQDTKARIASIQGELSKVYPAQISTIADVVANRGEMSDREVANKIAEEVGTEIPQEKIPEVLKYAVDFSKIDARNKKARELFDNLASPEGLDKHFEESEDLAEEAPKNKTIIRLKTKDGDEDLEVGTEYYLGRVVEHTKDGKEVYRSPIITILGENTDGTIKIRGTNGVVKDVEKSVLEDYKLGKVSDTTNNKKAKFFHENWNTVFEFNFGKGKKQIGRLEYSPKKGVLLFVYQKNGKRKSIEVTGDQFVPRKGFNNPMIRSLGTLTAVQQKSLEEYAKEKDARMQAKREARLGILEDLVNTTSASIDKNSSELQKRYDELQTVVNELSVLENKIKAGELTKRSNFRATTNRAIKAANRLSRLQDTLVREIQELETEKEELEFNLEYFYDLAQNIDELPTDSKDFLEELNNQVLDLEILQEDVGKQINTISKLIDNVEKALEKAVDFVKELIGIFDKTYPNVPTVAKDFQAFHSKNPNFLKLNPHFREDLESTEDLIAQVEDLDIIPNERTAKELRTELEGLQAQLKDVENQYRAKEVILRRFEKAIEDAKKADEEKKRLAADKEQWDLLFKAQQAEQVVEPADTSTEDDKIQQGEGLEKLFKLFTKTIKTLFTSSTSTSREFTPDFTKKPHLLRAEKFKNKWGLGLIPDTDKYYITPITANNQTHYGLSGLIQSIATDQSTLTSSDSGVILYAVQKLDENNTLQFVDQDGNILKDGVKENIVFDFAPSTSLVNTKGEKRYREEAGVSEKAFQDAWRQQREEWLKDTSGTIQPIGILGISRGFAQKTIIKQDGKDFYPDNNSVNSLVPKEVTDRKQVVFVSTQPQLVTEEGVTINMPVGRPYLKIGSTIEFLDSRPLTKEEGNTVFAVMRKLAEGWAQDKKLDKTLTDWLNSVVYWYSPSEANPKVHPHQIYVKDGTLHIGAQDTSIYFTPELMDINKERILSVFLQGNAAGPGTYHHVSNRALSKQEPYIEYVANEKGELSTVTHPSYQEYLLSKNILTTHIRKELSPEDANFQGRYMRLDVKLNVKEEPAPQQPVNVAPVQATIVDTPPATGTVAEAFWNILNGTQVATPTNPVVAAAKPTAPASTASSTVSDAFWDILNGGTNSNNTPAPETTTLADRLKSLTDENDTTDGEDLDNYRRVVEGEEALAKENIAEVEGWFKKNLPNVPFSKVKHLITVTSGGFAWGKFGKDGVTLYENAKAGTGYHEAFESVYSLFLTPEEKMGVHKEFTNRQGSFLDIPSEKEVKYSGASLAQMKEKLADEFADFVQKEKIGESLKRQPAIIKFFRNLWNLIKGLFSNTPSSEEARAIFSKINSGYYSTLPVNLGGVSADEYSRRTPFDYTTQHDLMQHITSLMLGHFFGPQKKVSIVELSDGKAIPVDHFYDNVRKFILKEYKRIATALLEGGYTEAAEKFVKLGEDIKANWPELVKINKEYLETFNIVSRDRTSNNQFEEASKKIDNSEVTEEDEDEDEGDEIEIIKGSRNQREYDRDVFTIDTKENATAAVKLLFATIRDAEFVGEEFDQGVRRAIKQIRYKRTSVQGFKFVDFARAFNSTLSALVNTNGLNKLIDKLVKHASVNPSIADLISQHKLNVNPVTGQMNYNNLSYDDWRLVIDFYKTMSKHRPKAFIMQNKNGKSVLLPANRYGAIEDLKKRFLQNIKKDDKLFTYDNSKKSYIPNVKYFISHKSLQSPQDYISFLHEIGINRGSNGEVLMTAQAYNRLTQKQKAQFTASTTAILNQLKKALAVINPTNKSLQFETPLNTVTGLIIQATSDDIDSTFFNIAREAVQANVLNNPYATFFNNFNSAANFSEFSLAERGMTSGFAKGSIILSDGRFFLKTGERTDQMIEVGYIDGTINHKGGKQSAKLPLIDRKLQSFNLNLEGWFIPITNGDKKTEWILSLGNPISYKEIVSGDAWAKINSIFHTYLSIEMESAIADFNRNLNNITDKNRGKLRFFLSILSPQLAGQAHSLIKRLASEQDIKSWISANSSEINANIKSYLSKEASETRKEFEKFSLITPSDATSWSFSGVSEKFVYSEINSSGDNSFTETELNNTLLYRTVNSVINNIEMHKVFLGDPAFMTQNIKRIPGASGGVIQALYNSQEFNDRFNDSANRVAIKDSASIPLSPSDLGHHTFRDDCNILCLNDIIVQGKGDYSRFKDINEADASSKMTLPAYREMTIRSGEWTDVQEYEFQHQMAFLRTWADTHGHWKYTSEALRAHDLNFIKNYKSNGAIFEVKKPKGFSQNTQSDERNIVYWKTSVQPLIPIAVIGGDKGSITNDGKLMLKMMKEGVNVAAVESAIKLGAKNLYSYYKADGSFNDAPYSNEYVVAPSWQDVGIQVETQFSQGKNTTTLSSQLTKVSTVNLMEAGEAIGDTPERKAFIKAAIDKNNRLLIELTNNGYEEMLNTLGLEDKGTHFEVEDYNSVIDFIKREARDLDDNTRSALRVNETLNKLQTPLEAIPTYTQLKAILYSLVDKSVASPKVGGAGLVQMTSWGSETGNRKMDGLLIQANDTLKTYTKEEPWCEIELPYWFARQLQDWYSSQGKRIPSEDELIKILNDSEEGRGILSGVGFRIPLQELNSAEVFKVKRFLSPIYGNAVRVNSEITKKVGSDFDVDKLNCYLKNVYINGEGKITAAKYFKTRAESDAFYGEEFKKILIAKGIAVEKGIAKNHKMQQFFGDIVSGNVSGKTYEKWVPIFKQMFGENATAKDIEDVFMKRLKKLGLMKADIVDTDVQIVLRWEYMDMMYRGSIENEYYNSLQELLQLPENYDKLTAINDATDLKNIRNTLNKALFTEEEIREKNIETGDKNRPVSYTYLMSPNTLDEIRHTLITGKYGVGIAAVAQTGNAIAQKLPVLIDIKRLTLNATPDRIKNLRDGVIRFSHNTHNGFPTISKILDSAGKIISRKISQYIDGFVDVTKDTFILEMGVNMKTAGIFLLMERLGNSTEHTTFFMNQPIIKAFIDVTDKMGFSLNSKMAMKQLLEGWAVTEKINEELVPVTYKGAEKIPSSKHLLANIEAWKKGGRDIQNMPEEFMAEQTKIFMEFIKYKEIANDLLTLTQGVNWDTAHISDPEMFRLKDIRYEKANKTLFTPASEILKHVFIGNMKDKLLKTRDAIGSFIALEHPSVRKVLDIVKNSFINEDFLPTDKKYSQVARRVNNSFINYILQVKGGYNKAIRPLLLDKSSAVAVQLDEWKKKLPYGSPFQEILSHFESFSDNNEPGSPIGVRFRGAGKDIYTRNAYTAGLRTLKEGPSGLGDNIVPGDIEKLKSLYRDLVRLALIQSGVQMSPISYAHLIPNEDFSQALSSLMESLPSFGDLSNFVTSDAFFRNNWKSFDIIPSVFLNKKMMGISDTGRPWAIPFILPPSFSGFERGAIMKSSQVSEYLKYQPISSERGWGYVPDTASTVSKKDSRSTGDMLPFKTYLYKLVRDEKTGQPIIMKEPNKKQGGYYTNYLYKAIAPWGNGQLGQEYYEAPRPSQFNNNTFQPAQEIPDVDIVKALNGGSVDTSQKISTQVVGADAAIVDKSKNWGQLENLPVYSDAGVNTMRTKAAKPDENFGNPFTGSGVAGLIQMDSIASAVNAYEQWLRGVAHKDVNPAQREWILNQIANGKLTGKKLLYMDKKVQGGAYWSHADALAALVNDKTFTNKLNFRKGDCK